MTSLFSDLISVSPGRRDFFTFEDIINEMDTLSGAPEADCELEPSETVIKTFKEAKVAQEKGLDFDKHKQKHRRLSESQVMKAHDSCLHLLRISIEDTIYFLFV